MDRSIFVALMDQVRNVHAGSQSEVICFAKRKHAGDRLPTPFSLLLRKRALLSRNSFQGMFDDFFGGAAESAGKGGFQHFLAALREIDGHGVSIAKTESVSTWTSVSRKTLGARLLRGPTELYKERTIRAGRQQIQQDGE